ncbi:MAG: RagB/SusD family nutrient uptake outer membrane protein [Mangrovibacterium sp.]
MKKIFLSLYIALALAACNDDFLEKYPIESQSEATAFKSNENFQTYAWGLYDVFMDYSAITRTTNSYNGPARGDFYAGYLMRNGYNNPNPYAAQVATTFADANDAAQYWTYATGGWSFSYVRRTNIMLDNIEDSEMNDTDKAHWRSVGYFFRAFLYAEMVSRFGDIPWVDHAISESDPIQNAPRDSRTVVIDHMMDDLIYAEENIKENGNGANTINTACVQFLISRIGLFEGTWREYHNVSDDNAKYKKTDLLEQSVRASEALMTAYPSLGDYDALFNSASLAANPGVVFYKDFTNGVLTHYMSRYCRTAANRWELPKYTVELYLSANGLPIHNASNTMYEGDKSMYAEFRNRDHRLYASVLPPYFEYQKATKEEIENGEADEDGFKLDADGNKIAASAFNYSEPEEFNTDYYEYVDLMPTVFASTTKRLPATAFNNNVASCPMSPNVTTGYGVNPLKSLTGYTFFRFYNTWEVNVPAGINETDMPIFHMSEIYLNYAEAKWELNQFDQAAAEISINKLRARAGVDDMLVSAIGSDFDPKRDPDVDPVLWEIRRERIVEMLGEGCGFDDIRRWKCAPWFINRDVVGCYLRYDDFTDKETGEVYANVLKIPLVNENFVDQSATAGSEGYVKRFQNQANAGKGWLDKYYLLPLPLEEKALNPNLLPDNPGW